MCDLTDFECVFQPLLGLSCEGNSEQDVVQVCQSALLCHISNPNGTFVRIFLVTE